MQYLQSIIGNLPTVKWTDLIDIILVAFLIYKLFPVFRSTGTSRIAWIIGVVLVVTWLTGLCHMYALNYILSQLVAVGLIALVILFQPELRRMIDHMSNIKLKEFLRLDKPTKEIVPVIQQTVRACDMMSQERVGALIVFARSNRLDEYFKTGTILDAQISEHLIRNIFFPKASLHDGAMIVRDGRAAAAGCVLPLSDSNRISADLGTRHRAALGVSEVSDAVVIVVSEETGAISVAIGGVLKRHLAPQTLERLLYNELCPETEEQEETIVVKLRQKLKIKDKEEKGDEK